MYMANKSTITTVCRALESLLKTILSEVGGPITEHVFRRILIRLGKTLSGIESARSSRRPCRASASDDGESVVTLSRFRKTTSNDRLFPPFHRYLCVSRPARRCDQTCRAPQHCDGYAKFGRLTPIARAQQYPSHVDFQSVTRHIRYLTAAAQVLFCSSYRIAVTGDERPIARTTINMSTNRNCHH